MFGDPCFKCQIEPDFFQRVFGDPCFKFLFFVCSVISMKFSGGPRHGTRNPRWPETSCCRNSKSHHLCSTRMRRMRCSLRKRKTTRRKRKTGYVFLARAGASFSHRPLPRPLSSSSSAFFCPPVVNSFLRVICARCAMLIDVQTRSTRKPVVPRVVLSPTPSNRVFCLDYSA